MNINYPVSLYEQTRPAIRASAAAIVPELVELFHPASVVDVGCGEGTWMAEFAALGCTVIGLDGPHVSPTVDEFVPCDLEQPIPAIGTFDLAVCLEVAEHLSPARADTFVAELCSLAPTVVLSAAIPGQGGAGHVNEQWPAFWTERFASYAYPASSALRWMFWDDQRIAPWYRQNLLVFGDLQGLPADAPAAVVHPEIWGWYR